MDINKKKKICLVSLSSYAYFHPELNIKSGGAEKQIYRISKLLAQNPFFDVSVCVADYGQLKDIEIIDNVKLVKTISYSQNKIRALFSLFSVYKKINSNVFIFRTADVGIGLSILFIKLILRKKILYFVASEAETNFRQSVKMQSLPTAISMSLAYPLCDQIIAQTQEQASLFQQNKKLKSIVIKSIYPTKNKLPENKKEIILWIGRATPWKQAKLFLRIVKTFPKQQFIMVAPKNKGQENYFQEIKKQTSKYSNLQFIDYVAPDKIWEYYQKALILINTSINEGFSNVMLEAMDAQCALLSLNANPDNFINEYQLGVCSMGNLNKLFTLLDTLLSDRAKTLSMGKNGKNYLQKNHHPQEIKKQIETQIYRLLK